jgi:transglutaminase-like putative cysteine protease
MNSTAVIPQQQGDTRESHRALRHICASVVVLCSLAAVEGGLPMALRGIVLPGAATGMLVSWLLRKRRLGTYQVVVVLTGFAHGFYWIWRAFDENMQPVTALSAAWVGGAVAGCFVANSQQAYRYIQGVALALLMLGGWMQLHPEYPSLLAATFVLLAFSCLAGRAAPTNIASVYLNRPYPSLETTMLRGVGLVLAIGLLSYPIYLLLPRLTPFQAGWIRQVFPKNAFISEQKVIDNQPAAQGVTSSRSYNSELSLSQSVPPHHTGEILFIISGPRNIALRCEIMVDYNGVKWTPNRLRREPLRASEDGLIVNLGRSEGMWQPSDRIYPDRHEQYQIQVRKAVGKFLPRPARTLAAAVPEYSLQSDPDGNLYVSPPLQESVSYFLKTSANTGRIRLQEDELDQRCLALPEKRISGKIMALVKNLSANCTNQEEMVGNFCDYIRKNCQYALKPHDIPPHKEATAYLLFEKKEGWCVHFASALAVMCRVAKIPARVVLGYGRGELDPLTWNYRVADRDAHAWVEANPDGQGWAVYDPTPASESPMQKPPDTVAEVRMTLNTLYGGLQDTGQGFKVWYLSIYYDLREHPWHLVYFLVGVLMLIQLLRVWRLRWLRYREARLWREMKRGTPRAAAKAAYSLVSRRLEYQGFGDVDHTTPEEYCFRLREAGHTAADALAFIVSIYETSEFGPQMTMRWDRQALMETTDKVMHSLKVRNLLSMHESSTLSNDEQNT